jgi:hypothetical protein
MILRKVLTYFNTLRVAVNINDFADLNNYSYIRKSFIFTTSCSKNQAMQPACHVCCARHVTTQSWRRVYQWSVKVPCAVSLRRRTTGAVLRL